MNYLKSAFLGHKYFSKCVLKLLWFQGDKQTHTPDSKDAAEVIHDAIQFVLQLLQEVAGLHIELEEDRCVERNSRVT